MSYRTKNEKALILAMLANFEFESARETWKSMGIIKRKNEKGKVWCLDAVVKLKTDYDNLGADGGFGGFKTDIAWNKRTKTQRSRINSIVRERESLYAESLALWMIARYEDHSEFISIELVLGQKKQPHWNIKMHFGPTPLESKDLKIEIQKTFEHYDRAGDLNFELSEASWKLCQSLS